MKYKIHKSIDTLPIACYDKIRKSIDAENPEYRWLIEFDYIFDELPKFENVSELKAIFENLTYQFEELDLNLHSLFIKAIKAFIKYKQRFLEIEIAKLENKDNELATGIKKQISEHNKFKANVYHSFDTYREKLNKEFSDFKFTEFFIETENKDLKDFVFYNEKQLLYKLAYHNLSSENIVLKSREVVYKSIDYIHNYLQQFYTNIDNLNEFFEYRLQFFNLSNLSCNSIHKQLDLDKEIITLETILKKEINKWKISVKKYNLLKKTAQQISNMQNSQKHSKQRG